MFWSLAAELLLSGSDSFCSTTSFCFLFGFDFLSFCLRFFELVPNDSVFLKMYLVSVYKCCVYLEELLGFEGFLDGFVVSLIVLFESILAFPETRSFLTFTFPKYC